MNKLAERLDEIEAIVAEAIASDNPDLVFQELKRLEEAERFVGMAKAKFIYILHLSWDNFSLSSTQSLQDTAFEYLNWKPYTVERYISMWQYRELIPASFNVDERPVREVVPITNALSHGLEIGDDGWDKLARTTKQEEVHAVLRGIRGEEPRRGSLQVYLHSDGSVVAWHNNIRYEVGFLDVNNMQEPVQKSIKRLVSGGGVILK